MWIVRWQYNDMVRIDTFDSQVMALLRMQQLEAYGMLPSLHKR